jgi:1-aminocyclopropane-1-carboxylate deaminase/D-cysteine desulfhydrase-like pyridoxal-dependent ACC family enzyme
MIINRNSEGYSPVEKRYFNNKFFYIKRDDLLSPEFSGNKARKFYYYLKEDFPNIKKVVSYGSTQSNAMYSISVLAKMKGWKFDYHVNHLSSYLEQSPHGNFKYALENGMELMVSEEKPLREEIESEEILFIEEGGRQESAELGLQKLAEEILFWKEQEGLEEINIFLPSGTGTTALYLQKNSEDRVYTVPCVGDEAYLKKQFFMLERGEEFHPQIVVPSKKRHFGKLYRDSYNIWLKLQNEMGLEFDLLYDPHGWLTLLEHPEIFEKPLLYIHQGGLIGNESMLARYQRKYGEDI